MDNILVTGGTGNLGKTVVNTLLNKSYKLHLPVRKAINDTENIHYYVTDLTSTIASKNLVKNIVEKADRITAGVFLAGGFVGGGLEKTSLVDINKMIALNFTTAFNSAKNLINHYKKVGGGKLIFIGAQAAMDSKTASVNMAYSISKQMLYSFVTLINNSEKVTNISAHILLPNALDTDLNRKQMPNADFSKWTNTETIAQTIANIIEGKELNIVIKF